MMNASYRPSDSEITQLLGILHMPGYEVLKKIQMAEVDFFQLDLLNTDPSAENYETLVRTRHSLALAAGMFHQRVTDKIAGYVSELGAKREQKQVIADATENLFD
jgi:hypothetical protein